MGASPSGYGLHLLQLRDGAAVPLPCALPSHGVLCTTRDIRPNGLYYWPQL